MTPCAKASNDVRSLSHGFRGWGGQASHAGVWLPPGVARPHSPLQVGEGVASTRLWCWREGGRGLPVHLSGSPSTRATTAPQQWLSAGRSHHDRPCSLLTVSGTATHPGISHHLESGVTTRLTAHPLCIFFRLEASSGSHPRLGYCKGVNSGGGTIMGTRRSPNHRF